jgi:hypothetical protein
LINLADREGFIPRAFREGIVGRGGEGERSCEPGWVVGREGGAGLTGLNQPFETNIGRIFYIFGGHQGIPRGFVQIFMENPSDSQQNGEVAFFQIPQPTKRHWITKNGRLRVNGHWRDSTCKVVTIGSGRRGEVNVSALLAGLSALPTALLAR